MPEFTITVSDPEQAETIQQAMERAADDRGLELKDSPGRPSSDELPKPAALRDVAAAFIGWDATGEYISPSEPSGPTDRPIEANPPGGAE